MYLCVCAHMQIKLLDYFSFSKKEDFLEKENYLLNFHHKNKLLYKILFRLMHCLKAHLKRAHLPS